MLGKREMAERASSVPEEERSQKKDAESPFFLRQGRSAD
jgi:hypothetical protein